MKAIKKLIFKKFEKNKYHKKILIIGDVYEKSNNQLEYILNLIKKFKVYSETASKQKFLKKIFLIKKI